MSTPETETAEIRKLLRAGIGLIAVGSVIAIVGALFAHFTGLPELDDLGREMYPSIPRGWVYETTGQLISVVGTLMIVAGIPIAFVYKRTLTWATASLGALSFVSAMMILFAVIPNQWLTLTQSVWEWTPQKILVTVPPALILGNEVQISMAALKDIISAGYVTILLGVVAITMSRYQQMKDKAATAPPPAPVSEYGRPLTKVSR